MTEYRVWKRRSCKAPEEKTWLGESSHRFPFLPAAVQLQPDQPRDSGKHLYPEAYPWLGIVLSIAGGV